MIPWRADGWVRIRRIEFHREKGFWGGLQDTPHQPFEGGLWVLIAPTGNLVLIRYMEYCTEETEVWKTQGYHGEFLIEYLPEEIPRMRGEEGEEENVESSNPGDLSDRTAQATGNP